MIIDARHRSKTDYRYGFNGMEKDDELKGEGNSYDFGARMFDPRIGRWFATDALESKYPNLSSYNFAGNNPIINIDFDGNDWGYSVFKKDGKTYIKIIFIGAVLNSSGKDINMKKLIANQKKEFEKVFGKGNVVTAFHVREIKSKDELNWNDHLIEIADPNDKTKKFKELQKGEDGFVGGYSRKGGKYIAINSKLIDKDGVLSDKKAVIHEIGHTGGLEHPFEFEELKNAKNEYFVNGNKWTLDKQTYTNPFGDVDIETNFMNYTQNAIDNSKNYNPNWGTFELQNYFNNTVGSATQGQIQTIINNIFYGNLNSDKDLPKDKSVKKTINK